MIGGRPATGDTNGLAPLHRRKIVGSIPMPALNSRYAALLDEMCGRDPLSCSGALFGFSRTYSRTTN